MSSLSRLIRERGACAVDVMNIALVRVSGQWRGGGGVGGAPPAGVVLPVGGGSTINFIWRTLCGALMMSPA